MKTILIDRCARCHAKGAEQEQFPLETYDDYLKYMDVPLDRPAAPAGWEWSDRQVSVEKLTQSTHAHLLSFAVLFALTGLTFALTDFPGIIRGTVAPVVLLAQVADVSCWWLARVPGYGPYFAMAIVGTGTVVGLGLVAHIFGGLWGMWGPRGRAVMALVLVAGFAGFAGLLAPKILSELQKEKEAVRKAKTDANQPKVLVPSEAPAVPAVPKEDAPKPAVPEAKGPAEANGSEMERLVAGPREGKPWKKGGSMAAAFFEKDGADFKKEFKDRGQEIVAEREGEREAVLAWIRLDDAARKAAYDADKLPLPKDRVGKPITPDFVADGHAKVRTILAERCVRCHSKDGDTSDFPLESYDQLKKYLGSESKTAAAEAPIPKALD